MIECSSYDSREKACGCETLELRSAVRALAALVVRLAKQVPMSAEEFEVIEEAANEAASSVRS